MDHGGALQRFLNINHTANVYVQRNAFDKHSSKVLFLKMNVGVDVHFKNYPQVILLDGDSTIDEELTLFTVPDIGKFSSSANDALYAGAVKDDFSHEQNLMISGQTSVLIMGCGHAGVVNILERAKEYKPKTCVCGYHL